MIGWGMDRREFWQMTPTELWWEFDARQRQKTYSGMSEDEVEELYQLLDSELKLESAHVDEPR